MSRKPTSKRTRRKPKQFFPYLIGTRQNLPFWIAWPQPTPNVDTSPQLLNSSTGTAQSRGCLQQDCCAPLSYSSWRPEARSRNSQSSLRSGATLGLWGSRLWHLSPDLAAHIRRV